MSCDDLQRLITRLKDREQWLTNEISGGGSWEHLNARRAECAYVLSLLEEFAAKEGAPQ